MKDTVINGFTDKTGNFFEDVTEEINLDIRDGAGNILGDGAELPDIGRDPWFDDVWPHNAVTLSENTEKQSIDLTPIIEWCNKP